MIPTSSAQADWIEGAELPPVEIVRDGVWSVPLAMPEGHIPYSLAYLVADDEGALHVIDPGLDTDENWMLLRDAISRAGFALSDVASIVCTHLHPDHLGLAERLRAASGAPVALLAAELNAIEQLNDSSLTPPVSLEQFSRWGVPPERIPELEPFRAAAASTTTLRPDVALEHGDVLDVPGRTIEVLATPGHTLGHLCLRDSSAGLIFTGDHILPTMFPGIGLGGDAETNAIADYLDSLDVVSPFDGDEVLPGHGYRFRGLAGRCADSAAHHLRRSREVETALADDPSATVWQVAEQLTWTAGWSNLAGFYVLSALRQVEMHIDFVRSERGRRRLSGESSTS